MRPKQQVTAVLLLGALATAGCSKRGDTDKTKSQEPKVPAQLTMSHPGDPVVPKDTDEEGFIPDKPFEITGPVSFADGEAAYQAKRYAEATTIFDTYTTQKPENAWGHFMLGLSAWKGGDLGKAEKAFETALSIDRDHFKSLVNLSRVLIDQKRYDDALEKLMRAGDVEPKSNEVYRLMGRALHSNGKADDAEDAYRQAIELDDNDAWSMNNLSLLLIEKKRAGEAVPLLTKAVELKKDVPAFHNNLGMALEHTGRFQAAATAYSDAVTADPGYEKAKQNLARVGSIKVDRAAAALADAESDDEKAGSR
jgi:Flp pilus assembly protein TadD